MSIGINHKTLLVWDSISEPPIGDWTLIFWRSFHKPERGSEISIPSLIENNAHALKKRLLEWIYSLGESNLGNKRLVDQLELRDGFSYWWMTLIAEKNYGKSSRFYDAVRLLVLNDLIQEQRPKEIIFVSNDPPIAKTIKKTCQNLFIDFKWRRAEDCFSKGFVWRRCYNCLPLSVQAIATLVKYLYQRKTIKTQNKTRVESQITFVDYLIHLDQDALKTKRFASNYWTSLLNYFAENKIPINWIHHYVSSESIPTAKNANDIIGQFNQNGSGLELHSLFDEAINFSMICSTIGDYISLVWKSIKLQKIKSHFQPASTAINFWPLFKLDWLKSMRGNVAMNNCILLNLIENTVKRLPQQQLGVYLLENQAWEMAFIYAWRANGHGALVGVQHSTVRYWDLRYFYNERSYLQRGKNELPMPDQVAVNGPIALQTYLGEGYPANQLFEVEALRFLYFNDNSKVETDRKKNSKLRVLICGDLVPEVSHQMMLLIEAASLKLPPNTEYILKPHPGHLIDAREYSNMSIITSTLPVSELFADCDVVFASNITSAAVDAYCYGLPVVQVLDANAFNLSPLRGLAGVRYVTNSEELTSALTNLSCSDWEGDKPFFCIDPQLIRWQKLLSTRPGFQTNCNAGIDPR